MANTYSALFYHIVFSTKGRKRWITPDIEELVWAYIGGVARAHGLIAIQVGGIEDHIHVLIMAKPVHSLSEIAKWLKGETSKWIHIEFDNMRSFEWQDGYGVFSVSKAKVPAWSNTSRATRSSLLRGIRGRIRENVGASWRRVRRAIFIRMIQPSLTRRTAVYEICPWASPTAKFKLPLRGECIVETVGKVCHK